MSERVPVAPLDATLLVEDLRLTLEDIGPLTEEVLANRDLVDAFLLTAGASQILRDALEDDPAHLLRAASVLDTTGPRRVGTLAARGATVASRAFTAGREALPARRALAEAAKRLDSQLDALATATYTGTAPRVDPGAVTGILERVSDRDQPWGRDSVRQPSCFRSFDQHPRDIQALAAGVLDRHPASQFMVVGVRTSGNYLAPLLAASLRLAGCGTVAWETVRPGRPPSPESKAALVTHARGGAIALVIDDPPTTGGSIVRVVDQLGALGYTADRVTLALALLEGGRVPDRLVAVDAVTLPWDHWDIHRRLSPESVRASLQACLGDEAIVEDLEPFVLPSGGFARGHAQVGYHVAVTDRPSGQRESRSVVAEGAGLGFFGRHVVAVSTALPGLVPDVIGFRDGVTLRQWLPDDARVVLDTLPRVRQAVHYVSTRRAVMPARRDAATLMAGQQPVWEAASRLLAAPYSVAGLAMRTAGLDAAVRTMLSARMPSVTDGQTGSRAWFEDDGAFVKVAFSDRSFSNLDLACYDAAYDVAGLALGTPTVELADAARAEFEAHNGVVVDPERWLLYRLVHLWDLRRLNQLSAESAETAAARVWQEWARVRLLGSSLDHGDGPWCAIDIDGVIETSRLGAPVLTPSAAEGLRALDDHGFRIVLATGRSLPELQDRCERYGLVGGVAEYGAVAYSHRTGEARELLDEPAREALRAGRACVDGLADVAVAEHFGASIRAFRLSSSGARLGLDADSIEAVLRAADGRLQAHPGLAQVDFVPQGVDKAKGLSALFTLLGDADGVLAFAFGDSRADLRMLRAADRGFVPAQSRHLAGGSVFATRHSYQRGFLDAALDVVGHAPGECGRCHVAERLPDGAAMVAALLAGLEGGRDRGVALIPEVLRLARRTAKAETPEPR